MASVRDGIHGGEGGARHSLAVLLWLRDRGLIVGPSPRPAPPPCARQPQPCPGPSLIRLDRDAFVNGIYGERLGRPAPRPLEAGVGVGVGVGGPGVGWSSAAGAGL